ncbi:MAG TPA: universal stress protein [Steroidobacter sp.]|uniref:universal stress protein n=1 Tax=Steroidobacter sp. TaxID=1978227 RepID=UPI002EDA6B2D
MYTRILVPVDGSDTALKGLAEALKLARALQARIKLIHVVNELINDPAMVPSVYYEHSIENMRECGRKALRSAQALAKQQHTEVDAELVETIGARACDCIVAAAKRWPADLIVMGTHGRRGLQRLALGSDAEMVLRSAPVPVLMVRENG